MLPTDEQSKAIQEMAKLGKTVVQEGGALARCIGKILGTIPEDVVNLIIGDPLAYIRAVNAERLQAKIEKIHQERNVTNKQPVSPSLAIPLIRAAYDESRDELQDLWARLLATAMDPNRSNRVRKAFIDTIQKLDPLDALILNKRFENPGDFSPNGRSFMASYFKVSEQEVEVSVENLVELRCVSYPPVPLRSPNFHMTSYGNELMRACLV